GRAELVSRHSAEKAPSASPVPPRAAASRRSNFSPITLPSIGTKCPDPQRSGNLCLHSPRNGGGSGGGRGGPARGGGRLPAADILAPNGRVTLLEFAHHGHAPLVVEQGHRD